MEKQSPPQGAQDAPPDSEQESGGAAFLRLMDIPALLFFALLFFTVTLQFVTRYVLNDSLGWTEEIARYLLIMLGFSGGIICVRNNSHIALEFFQQRLSPAALAVVAAFCRVVTGGFFLYCGWLAVELAQRTSSNMASITLPKAIIYYAVAAMCAITAAFAFAALLRRGKDEGESEHKSGG